MDIISPSSDIVKAVCVVFEDFRKGKLLPDAIAV